VENANRHQLKTQIKMLRLPSATIRTNISRIALWPRSRSAAYARNSHSIKEEPVRALLIPGVSIVLFLSGTAFAQGAPKICKDSAGTVVTCPPAGLANKNQTVKNTTKPKSKPQLDQTEISTHAIDKKETPQTGQSSRATVGKTCGCSKTFWENGKLWCDNWDCACPGTTVPECPWGGSLRQSQSHVRTLPK